MTTDDEMDKAIAGAASATPLCDQHKTPFSCSPDVRWFVPLEIGQQLEIAKVKAEQIARENYDSANAYMEISTKVRGENDALDEQLADIEVENKLLRQEISEREILYEAALEYYHASQAMKTASDWLPGDKQRRMLSAQEKFSEAIDDDDYCDRRDANQARAEGPINP